MTKDKNGPEPLALKIAGCLVAATADREMARACRARLEAIADAEASQQMVKIFARFGAMTSEQTRTLRAWPHTQMLLLKAVAIEACRLVESGVAIHCRGFARAGLPRSISVSLSEDHYLDLTFVGPELV